MELFLVVTNETILIFIPVEGYVQFIRRVTCQTNPPTSTEHHVTDEALSHIAACEENFKERTGIR
jgi:hypothetical protein